MPLTISPVVVHPSKSHEVVDHGHAGKQAVLVKLTPESVRALKEATAKARALSKSSGRPANALQILLSGASPVSSSSVNISFLLSPRA